MKLLCAALWTSVVAGVPHFASCFVAGPRLAPRLSVAVNAFLKCRAENSAFSTTSRRMRRPRVLTATAQGQGMDIDAEGFGKEIRVDIKGGIQGIPKESWDGLLRPDESPFLEHDWLYAMEKSKCATVDTGWQPQHLAVTASEGSSALIAAVPLYVKYHSMGEFIFDQSWADASQRAGLPYYPKLLVGVPFTPAAGARVLIDPALNKKTRKVVRKTIAMFLRKLAHDNNISSVHVNFCTEEEVEAFTSSGFSHRKGLQYHWRNQDRKSDDNVNNGDSNDGVAGKMTAAESTVVLSPTPSTQSDIAQQTVIAAQERDNGTCPKKYADFDSYLGNFASKRRIKASSFCGIRRERRSVYEDAGVSVTAYRGDDITDSMMETAFFIYKSTIDKMMYGRLYLNIGLFKELAQCFKRNIVLILAEKNGKVVAGTFNVVKAGRFYGRYWGAFETVKNLHFEACYYKAIEFCIENGLDVMEPGAGGGDFKFLRGFDPAIVNSCHYCTHPGLRGAVDSFLDEERASIDEYDQYLTERSALADRTKIANSSKSANAENAGARNRGDRD
ncbi:unnamed protein product [Ectocarpus sp. 12 AP-2014]